MAVNQQQKVTRQKRRIISLVRAGHQLWAAFPRHGKEGESVCARGSVLYLGKDAYCLSTPSK